MVPLSEEAQIQYDHLKNDLITLHAYWKQYLNLFGFNSFRVETINKVIPEAGYWIQRVMIESIVLGICRILDPEWQCKNQVRNLTLDTLRNAVEADNYCLACDISLTLDEIMERANPLFARRHKMTAHQDYKCALGEIEIDGFSREDIGTILNLMAKFMNTISGRCFENEVAYDLIIVDEGRGCTGLIVALQKSIIYDKLVDNGDLNANSFRELGDIYAKD